jgi:hypothetical protein
MQKEGVESYFNILSNHLPEVTGKSHEMFVRMADLQAYKRIRSKHSNHNNTTLGKVVLLMVCRFYCTTEFLSVNFCSLSISEVPMFTSVPWVGTRDLCCIGYVLQGTDMSVASCDSCMFLLCLD